MACSVERPLNKIKEASEMLPRIALNQWAASNKSRLTVRAVGDTSLFSGVYDFIAAIVFTSAQYTSRYVQDE
ncbi:hypothetical protein J6590_001650 [Homalodisca vitripennis]|nr:hypothetical protein J6590_001650 [Homalodisca vitripennis]